MTLDLNALSALLFAPLAALHAAENMIGRQSQYEVIQVLPAPRPVKVDGDLADWDWSGRIQVFADYGLRDRFSTETAAMWDKDADGKGYVQELRISRTKGLASGPY